MSSIPNGIYTIGLPQGGRHITNAGEGRGLELLGSDESGKDADKIKVVYNDNKDAYSLQFITTEKYISFSDEPSMNVKLSTGDQPCYFKIIPHEPSPEQFVISVADSPDFHVGMAMERSYPPLVAMLSFPDKQPWLIEEA